MNAFGRLAGTRVRAARWRVLAYAVLWGIGVASLEITNFPLERLGLGSALLFVPLVAPHWIAAGLVLAGFSLSVAPRLSPSVVLAITVLLVTPLAALVAYGVNFANSSLSEFSYRHVFGWPETSRTAFAYYLWPAMFYGGLSIAAWVWLDRSERTRRLLSDAELARSTAQAHLSQAQLQALQGQVDPKLLLRVLAEVQQRYGTDPLGADRMLDLLVAFLRAAMPAVRGGTSTLADEVTLLRAFAALSEQLEGGRVRWQLCTDAPPAGLLFPPLHLLPLVERLASTTPNGVTVGVITHQDPTSFALELHGAAPGWRDEALEYRLRVGLQGTFGNAWSLDVRDAPAPNEAALTLRLSLSAGVPIDTAVERLCSAASPEEMHHGRVQ